TSPILRIFSVRSSGENPRFLFKPCLILSPSKIYVLMPHLCNLFSISTHSDDFPAPDNPVNHKMALLCPWSFCLSFLVTCPLCQTILVDMTNKLLYCFIDKTMKQFLLARLFFDFIQHPT